MPHKSNKPEKLFDLIHSLSGQEKRYIKTNIGVGNKQEMLFSAIAKLNELEKYDEKKINKKIDTKNLSTLRTDLYNSILKHLRAYHSEETKKIRVYELLAEIEILQEKNLHKQVKERIEKAKNIAKEYHYDLLMLKLLLLEKTHLRLEINKQNLTALSKNHEDTDFYIEKATQSFRLIRLYDEMFLLMRNKKYNGNENLKVDQKADELIHKNLKHEEPSTSLEGKMAYHNTWIIYYKHFAEDTRDFMVHSKTLIEFFNEHPKLIKEFPQRYIYLVNNYLNGMAILKDYSEFPQKIADLENLFKRMKEKENVQIKIFETVSYLKILWRLGEQDYPKALTILPAVEEGLKKYGEKISLPYRMGFSQSISLAYLHSQKYEKALDYLNEKLDRLQVDNPKNKSLPDIQLFCRVIRLVAYFELHLKKGRYYDLCISEARSIGRASNQSTEKMRHYVKLVTNAIAKAIGHPPDKRKKVFEKLYQDLKDIKGYTNGKEQVLIWLKRKIF